MKLLESLRVAWLGVSGNKMRTFLTMLGVIIGISSVIVLVSVGQGAKEQVTSQINDLGSNLIFVSSRGQGGRLDMEEVQRVGQQVEGVGSLLPTVSGTTTVKYEGTNYDTSLEGVTEAYPQVRNHRIGSGRFLSADDVTSRRRVAVVGTTVAEQVFGGMNPLGQHVRILGQDFTVIGVMEKKGTGMAGDPDDRVWIPVSTAQRLTGSTRINTLYLTAANEQETAALVARLTDYFTERFHNEEAVRVQSQEQILQTASNITGTLTMMLGAIAGISLVVGGIGIMNIMLVSVTERTREIGIRKAVGAKKLDILLQFLFEALFLAVAGGLIGIGLGYLGAQMISRFGLSAVVSAGSVLLSFTFSAAVGIVFGIGPAMRAANLDPIEALRRD